MERASFRASENAAINLREESELHRTVESLMEDVESHRRQLAEEVATREKVVERERKLRMEVLELQEQMHQYQRNEVVFRVREEKLRSELDRLKESSDFDATRPLSPTSGRAGSFKFVRLTSPMPTGWA